MQFLKQEVSCLEPCLSRVQTLEQTQEVSLPEGCEGTGRVLGTWGQPVMRSKEWLGSSILLTGGVQVWVLYESEAGELQCLNTYIPFRMDWELPEGREDGWIRIRPLLRSADARAVSAGKLLIRVGIAALAEAFCTHRGEVFSPDEVPAGIELLRSHWPVWLRKEAGEKTFEMDQTLSIPDSVPGIDRLFSWQLDCSVTDKKIVGNKIVFRGSCKLHAAYLSQDGQLRCWDFDLPFSQYAELQQVHSTDARGDVSLAVTRLELEQDDTGNLHLRAGLTGQYLVEDRQMLETVEDAFSPHRNLTFNREMLKLPVLLDSRRETVTQQQTVQISADMIADQVFYADFPRKHREGDQLRLVQPGVVQMMYYDTEGRLQSSTSRLEGELVLRVDAETELTAVPVGGDLSVRSGVDSAGVHGEITLQTAASVWQEIPMVKELELGELKKQTEDRPSLILCRAGNRRLWDIARENGSTVSAIQSANALTGEPENDRMLLIPVV